MDSEMTMKRSSLCDYKDIIICLLLIVATALVYYQVGHFEFLSFDDYDYVSQNRHVITGLNSENLIWALGFPEKHYWSPLSFISHMIDSELFGTKAGMHHLMNMLFHILNSLLLFGVLRIMTGSRWRSALVAGLFALHPVNVDTVAWIAERKNIISTTFWLLSLFTYFFYVRKPGTVRYILLTLVFMMGLCAKPMLVTLPFVFLLFDYWPLKRISIQRSESRKNADNQGFRITGVPVSHLILEKVPLLILSLATIIISSASVKSVGMTVTTDMVPMGLRIENAITSCIMYFWKMLWPMNLTFFYPYPNAIPLWQVIGSLAIILLITFLALRVILSAPYFMVGWLWFLGTLAPVSGIMQGGLWPAIAERWAYVPYIGLFIAAAWGLDDLMKRFKLRREAFIIVSVIVLGILVLLSWRQTGFWKDDFTLYSHGVKVDKDNYVAHANLAFTYSKLGEKEKAVFHYEEALRMNPNDLMVLNNMGDLYRKEGSFEQAENYYLKALSFNPDNVRAMVGIAYIVSERGELDKAFAQFNEVIRRDPNQPDAYYCLGILWAKRGEIKKANENFIKSLELNPYNIEAHCSYGVVLMNQLRVDEAIGHFKEALKLNPKSEEARNYLSAAMAFKEKAKKGVAQGSSNAPVDPAALYKQAVSHASRGELDKALAVLGRLLEVQPGNPEVFYNIACIHARQGKAGEAVSWLEKAVSKGFRNWELIETDKDFEGIRASREYKDFIARSRG